MVMVLPAMVADSVAGGLTGGGLGGGVWAERAAAAMSSPVQARRDFMVMFLLWGEVLREWTRQRDDCRTGRWGWGTGKAELGGPGVAAVMMRRKALHAAETRSI